MAGGPVGVFVCYSEDCEVRAVSTTQPEFRGKTRTIFLRWARQGRRFSAHNARTRKKIVDREARAAGRNLPSTLSHFEDIPFVARCLSKYLSNRGRPAQAPSKHSYW